MRHRNRGRKLNRNSQSRKALLRGLCRALILSKDGRIVTTPAKAKEAAPFLHRLVTRARAGTLADIRRILADLADKPAAMKLVKEIAPQMKGRPGGYTRILHLGAPHGRFRAWSVGDAADKALFEFVGLKQPEDVPPEAKKSEKTGIIQKLRERIPGKKKAKSREAAAPASP